MYCSDYLQLSKIYTNYIVFLNVIIHAINDFTDFVQIFNLHQSKTTICQLVNFKFHFIIHFSTNCWYTRPLLPCKCNFVCHNWHKLAQGLILMLAITESDLCVSHYIWTAERSSKETDDKNWQSATSFYSLQKYSADFTSHHRLQK